MASRTRRASPSASVAALGIEELPPELLSRCLGCLHAADRHRAALVSRRWRSCALAPELCRCVALKDGSAAGYASLEAFLLRHGQHVRSLSLSLETYDEHGEHKGAAVAALHACLATGASHAPLRELHADIMGDFDGLDVPPLPSSLRQVNLGGSLLTIGSGLLTLTQLTRLNLHCDELFPQDLPPEGVLPASIEWLRYMETHAQILKEQVLAPLTRISTLVLQQAYFDINGFESLTCLPTLRQLQISESHHVPDCLGQLTQLDALVLWDAGQYDVEDVAEVDVEAANAALNAAVLQLTRLTSLCIHNVPACRSLPALAALEQLQRLCLTDCLERGSLPAGAWCSCLRELGASSACLRRTGGALAQAPHQLSRVVALGRAADPGAAFLRWAAAHPPLQQLDLYSWRAAPMPLYLARPALEQAVQQLRRERPQLGVAQQLTSPLKNDFSRSFLLDSP